MNTRQYMRYIQYMLYKQYIPIQYNTCITYNTYNIYNTYQYKPIHAIQVNTIFSSILVQYIQIHTNTIEYMHYTYQYKNTNKYGKLRFNTNKRVLCLYWSPNTILKFQYRQYRHEVPVMNAARCCGPVLWLSVNLGPDSGLLLLAACMETLPLDFLKCGCITKMNVLL